MTKFNVRLFLYVGANACAFALAGLNVAMFGDGTLDWPHFYFAWSMFGIGLAASTFNITRSFIDTTAGAAAQPTSSSPTNSQTPTNSVTVPAIPVHNQ